MFATVNMITVQNLSKIFDTKTVINDLSFKIAQGEIIGLLGPNGAGKTTTLRMLAGVLPPTKGLIEIDGSDLSANQALNKRIGYLPENNPLYEELTVEEYLRFWSEIKGVATSDRQTALDFVVNHCGLAEVYYRPIGEISKGYRQRVGLSQAILTRPEILILDEPTEGLDPNQRQDIASLITNLGKQRTVIISSHVLSEVSKIATRLIILHQGKIVADESPENMRRLGQETRLVETELLGENIIPVLEKLPEVKAVSRLRDNYYLLKVTGKKDIRPDIFKAAVTHGWTLLTLVQKEQALEDVFTQLTNPQ